MKHYVQTTVTPAYERLSCECGWSHMELRNQNAYARKSRIRAAIRYHLDSNSESKIVRETARINKLRREASSNK